MALHSQLRTLCDDYARGVLERGDYRRKRAELLAQLTAPPRQDEPVLSGPVGSGRRRIRWVAALVMLAVAAGATAVGWYLSTS